MDNRSSIYPLEFSSANPSAGAQIYLQDPAAVKLLKFFEAKGLAALKDEDRCERWYEDFLAYQKEHRLYASVLAPQHYSNRGNSFDLLRYVRFLELFAYCSPAHGYSLQVTFLGLFSILMGDNEELKREAVSRLEAGELFAFGVSEKKYGSDLMANEFLLTPQSGGDFIASGSKYYIGNANAASVISVLGRENDSAVAADSRTTRLPFVLIALRPKESTASWKEEKIRTLGVRAAHVGAFQIMDHPIPRKDIIAKGRQAWDAVFGTVTLGKFFLGFGTLGICQHAFGEAAAHLKSRTLYNAPAMAMPHLRAMMCQAYARLLAMKLYAYRALDYVHGASAKDRRYALFCAIQKARVSTEGVKVVALLSECIGAKGFEADTWFEMALRDVALIPGLEGSMHINLGLAMQFLPRYFQRHGSILPEVASLLAGETGAVENPYLMSARTGATHAVEFSWFIEAYRPFISQGNVARFVRQAAAFRRLAKYHNEHQPDKSDTQVSLAFAQCFATIVYAQLIAENGWRLRIPAAFVNVIFSLLVTDMSTAAINLAGLPSFDARRRTILGRMISVPSTTADEWSLIAAQFGA